MKDPVANPFQRLSDEDKEKLPLVYRNTKKVDVKDPTYFTYVEKVRGALAVPKAYYKAISRIL